MNPPCEIEPEEQSLRTFAARIAQKSGTCAGALGCGYARTDAEAQRKSVAVDLLLDAEGVRRAMDTQFAGVEERRDRFAE